VEIISPTYDFAPEKYDEEWNLIQILNIVAEARWNRKQSLKYWQVGYNKTKGSECTSRLMKTLYTENGELLNIDVKKLKSSKTH